MNIEDLSVVQVTLEKQLENFEISCTKIHKSLQEETLRMLRQEARDLASMRTILETSGVLGTLQYMAKQITELTQHVHSLKEEGINKKIRLDLTIDGYEMVKKKPPIPDAEIFPEPKIDPEKHTQKLLKTLGEQEQQVIIHRYGLFGEKSKTLRNTGVLMKLSGERIRSVESKALKKMRHASRKELVKNLTHLALKIAIKGEEY